MTAAHDRGAPPLSARVVRANLLVASVTALSLAAAATLAAHLFWQARERRRVEGTAVSMAEAIRNEAADEGHEIVRAAADVFNESALPGFRFEAWREGRLMAANDSGPTIGPPAAASASPEWIASARPVDGGLVVVVGTRREQGFRALQVFVVSLAGAAPFCLLLAFVLGRHVSRNITRPLEDLRDRLVRAQPSGPFPGAGDRNPPLEVREIEAALRDLWERLARALERETEFAANASHELRTPLTRIRLHVEHASRLSPPAARTELDDAVREIDRTGRLVDSLLVLARDVNARVPREVVNVADVCRQAARRVFLQGPEPDLRAPDEAVVFGDERLIDVAVENLLDNARKFSRPGAAVTITVAGDPQWVTVAIRSPGARVEGAERERVFERFYRGAETSTMEKGHGLGLSLSRHIARLHGGESRCTSADGEDACFVLELPAWKPSANGAPSR